MKGTAAHPARLLQHLHREGKETNTIKHHPINVRVPWQIPFASRKADNFLEASPSGRLDTIRVSHKKETHPITEALLLWRRLR